MAKLAMVLVEASLPSCHRFKFVDLQGHNGAIKVGNGDRDGVQGARRIDLFKKVLHDMKFLQGTLGIVEMAVGHQRLRFDTKNQGHITTVVTGEGRRDANAEPTSVSENFQYTMPSFHTDKNMHAANN